MLEVVFCEAPLPPKKSGERIRELLATGDHATLHRALVDEKPLACGKVEIKKGARGRKYCSRCRKRIASFKSKVHWTTVAEFYRTLACHICGGDCDPSDKDDSGWVGSRHPSTDHVVPRTRGGTDEMENLRLAHFLCNSRRGATQVDEILRSAGRATI